jgi:hypothetical protein
LERRRFFLAVTIEELNIELTSNASKASDAIGGLSAKLKELKSTSDAGAGLQKISGEAKRVTENIEGMSSKGLSNAHSGLKKISESASSAGVSLGELNRVVEQGGVVKGLKKTREEAEKTPSALGKLKSGFAGARDSLKSFAASIKRIMLYRIIRSLLKQVAEAFMTGVNNLYQYSLKASTQFAKSMDSMATSAQYFQNSIAALAAPLYQAIIPVLVQITDWAATALNGLSRIIAYLTGAATYTAAVKSTKAYADNLSNAAGSAKKLKDYLLGIDELNVLNDSASTSGSASTTPDYGSMFEERQVGQTSGVLDMIKENLKEIMIAGGLFALAIGLVLLFTGHFALGIAMIAAGAATLYAASQMDDNTAVDSVKQMLGRIMEAAGAALLSVGLLLCLTGVSIPLGLGLIAVGAVVFTSGLAMTMDLPENVRSMLSTILTIVGVALLAIGLILCLTGVSIPLGIGLVLAGAVALATSVNLSDTMERSVENMLSTILAAAGLALIALGVILCLTGAGIPLGVGLIIAGVSTEGAAYAISSKDIEDWVNNTLANLKTDFENWWSGVIDGFKSGWDRFVSSLKMPSISNPLLGVGAFASGGFPEEGQMFVAREAGAEMVGSIGGRTAVANNDQIVAGISQGVYEAVMAAMSSSDNTVNVTSICQLDGEVVYRNQQRVSSRVGQQLSGNPAFA